MSKIVKKHDQLARKFLIYLIVAREFLEIYLPLEIRNRCDLSTISIESGAYIENDLQSHYSDVVYKVNFKRLGSVHISILWWNIRE